MEMQLSWLWPCSYPSEYLRAIHQEKKSSSSLFFTRRAISCRSENTLQKINKTGPILSININNAVLDFKGSFVTDFIIRVQNGSVQKDCFQCFLSELPVPFMSHLIVRDVSCHNYICCLDYSGVTGETQVFAGTASFMVVAPCAGRTA